LYRGLWWLLKVRETALEEKRKCGGCSGELPWLVAVMVDGCSDIEEFVVAHGSAVWVNRSAAVEKKKKSGGNVGRNGGCLLG